MDETMEQRDMRAEAYQLLATDIQRLLAKASTIPFKEREISLVVTKLEEAKMWADKGESLHGPEVEF